MAQLLFRMFSKAHPDPVKDKRGSWKKGFAVSVKRDGWWRGNPYWDQSAYVDINEWGVINCPEITKEEADHYIQEWVDAFDYQVVSSNPAQGRYTVRVFETNVSAQTGQNGITKAKVEAFLTRWGCTDISESLNSVEFTFTLWNAVRSVGFWELKNIGSIATFTLVSYQSGVGRIRVDVQPSVNPSAVFTRIVSMGGVLVSAVHPVYVFDIERSMVLRRVRESVQDHAQGRYRRRRFKISEELCDTIKTSGGIITMTKAELIAAFKDGLAE